MSFRSALYLLARLLGDIAAARKGPRAIATRIARKAILRKTGQAVNRIR